jgi:hypothetical protein
MRAYLQFTCRGQMRVYLQFTCRGQMRVYLQFTCLLSASFTCTGTPSVRCLPSCARSRACAVCRVPFNNTHVSRQADIYACVLCSNVRRSHVHVPLACLNTRPNRLFWSGRGVETPVYFMIVYLSRSRLGRGWRHLRRCDSSRREHPPTLHSTLARPESSVEAPLTEPSRSPLASGVY